MGKYLQFFKASYQIAFSYRASIIVRLIRDVVMTLFFVLLWATVFQNQQTVGSFTFKSIVTYYILVRILEQIYAFEPASLLTRDIKHGDLSNFLLKPLGYLRYLAFYTFGRRVARTFLTLIFIIALFMFAPTLIAYTDSPINGIAFILSATLSWILLFEISIGVGELSFWFSETGNIRRAIESFTGILGGLWVPLELFPKNIYSILNLLPFKYLYSFPVSIYQGKISGYELLFPLIVQLIWVLVLTLVIGYVWKKGVINYESYGR